MNKTTEALKLAEKLLDEIHRGNMTPMAEESWDKALAVIRDALAEREKQEPVQAVTDILDKCISLVGTEMVRCTQAGDKWFMCQRFVHAMRDMQYEFKRDYAAPAQQVDLTDEEIEQCNYTYLGTTQCIYIYPSEFEETGIPFARAVIDKFKEKNHYATSQTNW